LLRALIKLAAAGVKVREGQPHGITVHAGRAQAIFEAVRAEVGRSYLGLDLDDLISQARRITEEPPRDPSPPGSSVVRVFGFAIDPL
jgi:hypothetical protein